MDPCLDDAAVVAFAEGQLPDAELAKAEAHIAECEECRQLVSELARGNTSVPDGAAVDPLAATAWPDTHAQHATEKTAPVREGDVLAGKYKVERVLGRGGMGIVVAATDTSLGRKVALKFLLPAVNRTKGAVLRFLREARAAVKIESEHVARVIEVGTLEHGEPYIVMELLRGTDFARLIQTDGPLPVDDAIDYVLQASEALAEAHALGIVHRDIKPANLFLTQRADGSPLVKVLDFGISKGGEEGSSTAATSKNVMMGSPRYMSPEQMVSAHDADARTDVWALGLCLFEMLTGKAAFDSESIAELCTLVATAPPPPLRSHRKDAPAALEAAIFACLEKKPADRLQSVGELAKRLAPLAPPRAKISVERIERISGRAVARERATLPPGGEKARGSRRALWLAAGVALVAVMGIVATSMTTSNSTTTSLTTSNPPKTSTSASTATTTTSTTSTSTATPTSTPDSTYPSAAPSALPATTSLRPRPSAVLAPSASARVDENRGLQDRK